MKIAKWIFIVLVMIAIAFVVFNLKNKPQAIEQTSLPIVKDQPTFLIDGYPIDKVPLYKLSKVSSNKIFVNTDPKNSSEFDENNFAYFNVVFDTSASQEEFFNYYKNLFDNLIADESEDKQMVKGQIGEYRVSVAHYGSGNTAYVQVHFPNYNEEKVNKYFQEFPDILKINSNLIEHEKSYGLLNQKNGEIEFTKYFTVIDSGDKDNDGKDDVDEFLVLKEEYQKQYEDKPEYSFDEKSGLMKWRDGDFESTLSFSKNHGRLYLMLRKKI